MMRLFLLDISSVLDEEIYSECLNMLDKDRRSKAERIKNANKAAVSAGAGMLLDYALDEVGVRDKTIIKNSKGKPYLKSKEIYFNLSHSENMAV